MRIILYTGKGGVGKTSIAAATACQISAQGKRVLIMSTDQAHSLGDSFDRKLANEPVLVAENLYAMEVDAVEECEKAWGSLRDYMKTLMTSRSGETIEAEELLVFPGFEELTSLFKILKLYQENKYDVLIIDCAPTGETLALLKYPELFGEYINKMLPIKKKAVGVVGPAIEKLAKVPMPQKSVFDEVEVLVDRLQQLQTLMHNKEIVSIRIVTTPEQIVVTEAKRNYSFLHLYNYNVDAVIINKLYPTCSMEGYFSKWEKNQKQAVQDIEESFKSVPRFCLELQPKELRTVAALRNAAQLLYGATNPEPVLFDENIFEITREGDEDCFSIKLPFLNMDEVDLYQKREELIIIIKNERRKFFLPAKLRNREVTKARYTDGKLKIFF